RSITGWILRRMVGRSSGIFHKRVFVCGAHRRTHLTSEAAHGNARGRRTTPQRHTGRFSLLPFKSLCFVLYRSERVKHDFHFSSHLSNAATLCARYPPSWCAKYGRTDGCI